MKLTGHRSLTLLATVLAISVINSCSDDKNPIAPKDATAYQAQVAISWFQLTYNLVKAQSVPPPPASRIYGYAGVTLYEALVPGMPGYNSLVGQLNGLSSLAKTNQQFAATAVEEFHWPTVANNAMATILRNFFSNGNATTLASISTLQDSLNNLYDDSVTCEVFERSVERGKLIAVDIFSWALDDGFPQYNSCAFTPPVGPGKWIPTPPAFAGALQPCWGELRPFAITDGSTCNAPAPPTYDETPSSPFYLEMMEVYDTVQTLNAAESTIAIYWADNPGQTGTPPGHSISITGQVLMQENSSLAVAAEAYAKVGIGVADAFISCWWTKYNYNYLRPVTAIRTLVNPSWLSPIATPPFPEYTSGHSVQSGATAEILTDLFGAKYIFTDHTHDALGFIPRSFNSFYEAADEAAISKLYGGIHFRSAIDLGVAQGTCVGQQVLANLVFRNPI